MTFDITTSFLSDEDAERLYLRQPELRDGTCPTCRGTGTFRWQGADQSCACATQLQLAKHYGAAGIGVTYQGLDWGDYREQVPPALGDYLLDHERYVSRGIGVLFAGTIGTGKTLLATLMLKELIKLGYSCFSTTFARTVEAFTATWGNPTEKEWFARKFMYSQVLLLDDLGRELRIGNSLPQSTFDMILRVRVQDGRPTLLTTNCSLRELETGYGAGILSLLSECSIIAEFAGEDFRPQASRRTIDEVRRGETRPLI